MYSHSMAKTEQKSVIPIERIAAKIYLIRNQKIMLDSDLADLYGVTTGRLNEQVKRNKNRFPDDFAFQLTRDEYNCLTSQNAILEKTGRGHHRKYLPYAFTEHGVLMLSSVLRSERATQVNIAIVRAFVRLREMLATHKDIARKIEEHDRQIAALYDYVQKLLEPPAARKKPIGYIWPEE